MKLRTKKMTRIRIMPALCRDHTNAGVSYGHLQIFGKDHLLLLYYYTKPAIVGSRDIPDCEAKSNKVCWAITFLSSRIKRFRKEAHFMEKEKTKHFKNLRWANLLCRVDGDKSRAFFQAHR